MDESESTELLMDTSIHEGGDIPSVMYLWRRGLESLVLLYEIYRPRTSFFTVRVFSFFVVLNICCYWLAITTAFPFLLVSYKAEEYFWLQIPVGFLGASFDTASLFLTLWIARNALKSKRTWQFILHLSLDLLIAFLATMWVVLVFIVSGWVMSYLLGHPEQLSDRSFVYQDRLLQALLHPFENKRNIYFGLMMGFSAGLPSFVHIFLFIQALFTSVRKVPSVLSKNTEQSCEEIHT